MTNTIDDKVEKGVVARITQRQYFRPSNSLPEYVPCDDHTVFYGRLVSEQEIAQRREAITNFNFTE